MIWFENYELHDGQNYNYHNYFGGMDINIGACVFKQLKNKFLEHLFFTTLFNILYVVLSVGLFYDHYLRYILIYIMCTITQLNIHVVNLLRVNWGSLNPKLSKTV